MKKLILFLTFLQIYSYSNTLIVEDAGKQLTSFNEIQQLSAKEKTQIQIILKSPEARKQIIKDLIQNTKNSNEQLVLNKLLETIEKEDKPLEPETFKKIVLWTIKNFTSIDAIKAVTYILISIALKDSILAITNVILSGEAVKLLVEARNILAFRFADKSISGILGVIYYFSNTY